MSEKEKSSSVPLSAGALPLSAGLRGDKGEKIEKNSIPQRAVQTFNILDPSGRTRAKSEGRREFKDEFENKLLDLARVARMTGGGRRLSFRAVVIIGNKNGRVGLGVAKGKDVARSVEKATRVAKKNLITVPIVDGTIPYEVEAKFGAAEVLLRPQRKGRGLIAGGTVRVICRLAGIRDISSKILGRTGNKLNNAKATMEALQKLKIQSSRLYRGFSTPISSRVSDRSRESSDLDRVGTKSEQKPKTTVKS